MTFCEVAENLRQSFRVLAENRPGAEVAELPGISIASLGVMFQMFNAAFLSAPVETPAALAEKLQAGRRYFDDRRMQWSFWICEDWLASAIQRKLSRACESYGLRLSAEMPGMAAAGILPPVRRLPPIEVRRVEAGVTLNDFRAIGSTSFHVPILWFSEVFDERVAHRGNFVCWIGYHDGIPVATAATVRSGDVLGIYNVATAPQFRRRGYGEAITRYAIGAALEESAANQIVLQSTSQGQGIYDRMGFRPVTRVLVYNSVR